MRCPALAGELGACRCSLARRLPGATCWRHAAPWLPTAAALCRVAFAGGLFPFHSFERSRALFWPWCFFSPCFFRDSCPDRGPLRCHPRPGCRVAATYGRLPLSPAALKRSGPAVRLYLGCFSLGSACAVRLAGGRCRRGSHPGTAVLSTVSPLSLPRTR